MGYSEENTFEKIMTRMLANERLSNVDKRVGSIAYDAIAPCAMELAELYMKMDILESQTYLLTATGNSLDKRVYDFGVIRRDGTFAQRIGKFQKYKTNADGDFELNEDGNKILVDMEIPIDSRFTIPENSTLIYRYIGKIDGHEILQCEQSGSAGNTHVGTILPIISINDLIVAKITGTYKPAEDRETDDELRKRTLEIINNESFGGNIADYIEFTNEIDGVGNTKVFPAWQFNGSVLLSIVDQQFNPVSQEFIAKVKEIIDPEENSGEGVGIAPIGHYVTVTTPQKIEIKISITVQLEVDVEVTNIQEGIEREIESYFNSVRREFGQDNTLAIYRSRIIDSVLNVREVLNVTNVLLNDSDEDIIMSDVANIGGQKLPFVKEVVIV